MRAGRLRLGPATAVFVVLARIFGCPCCGPEWYRALARRAYREQGEPLPPELDPRAGAEYPHG